MENVYEFFGRQVRKTRENLKLTQERLAFKANISPNFLGQIERGTKKASLVTIGKLAEAMGVSISELTKGEKEKSRKYGAQEEAILYYVQDRNSEEKEAIINFLKSYPLLTKKKK